MNKIIYLFTLCFLLFSCQEDEAVSSALNDNNTEQTVTDNEFVLQNFGANVVTNFSGIIEDVDGNKLSEVQINIGNQTAMTDENGVFFLNDAVVYENFAYITANKNGYIKASRAVVPMQNGVNEIAITLLTQNTIATITAGEISEVSLPNGTQVAFAGGFVNASGETYNGAVSVSLYYLEPNQQDTFTQMPGMLYGKRTDGSATGMETYGMLSVNLYGANGEVLNIDKDTPATLKFPVSATTPNAPESMPLWYFDEVVGYWKEQGQAVKVGNEYIAEVAHFTWWNCDFPLDTVNVCFSITTAVDLSDFYFEIIRNETNQTVYSGYTNDTGEACGLFPKDEVLTLKVYGSCSNEVIHTQAVGAYGEDVTTTYIVSNLPAEYSETTITANVTDCDGNSLINGYALLGNDGTTATEVVSISNGVINYELVYCAASNYYIKVYDVDNEVNSDVITLTLVAPETSLGVISACGSVTYEIGDLVAGGVVFYVAPTLIDLDGNGTLDSGLVCALSNYNSEVNWGCTSTDLPNVPNIASSPISGLGAEIGDGMTNTNAILNDCPSSPAALAARSLGAEWFLPSVNELKEMYSHAATLENVSGFDTFSNYYWSSTERYYFQAWVQLSTGFQTGNNKGFTHSVRAIRAF